MRSTEDLVDEKVIAVPDEVYGENLYEVYGEDMNFPKLVAALLLGDLVRISSVSNPSKGRPVRLRRGIGFQYLAQDYWMTFSLSGTESGYLIRAKNPDDTRKPLSAEEAIVVILGGRIAWDREDRSWSWDNPSCRPKRYGAGLTDTTDMLSYAPFYSRSRSMEGAEAARNRKDHFGAL